MLVSEVVLAFLLIYPDTTCVDFTVFVWLCELSLGFAAATFTGKQQNLTCFLLWSCFPFLDGNKWAGSTGAEGADGLHLLSIVWWVHQLLLSLHCGFTRTHTHTGTHKTYKHSFLSQKAYGLMLLLFSRVLSGLCCSSAFQQQTFVRKYSSRQQINCVYMQLTSLLSFLLLFITFSFIPPQCCHWYSPCLDSL